MKAYTYCSFCGSRFPDDLAWPRTCPVCHNTTYRNPLPVAVVLVPVDGGLLLIRRAVAPHVGKLALPGGYINIGESWQAAGAREVMEETGLSLDPAAIHAFRVCSAADGTVLIFGIAQLVDRRALLSFLPTPEASECVVIEAVTELAFPLHTEVVRTYFQQTIKQPGYK
jgi:ADP-ribose pyrophosphatase YjhB (NUDIX family)